MKAFKGSEDFKNELLELDKEHQRLGMHIKGAYGKRGGEEFKGCSVGCLIYSLSDTESTSNHAYLAERLGVPEFVVHLQDEIFEGLKDSSKWTEQLLNAIPVGADLNPVLPKLLKFLVEMNPSDQAHHKMTVDVLDGWIETGSPDTEAAGNAASAAWTEAEESAASDAWAAWASSASSAARTAWAAARAAARATRVSEWAARAARAASHDDSGGWEKIAAEFLRLIRECK